MEASEAAGSQGLAAMAADVGAVGGCSPNVSAEDRDAGDALFALGLVYEVGYGVPPDAERAEELFSAAAARQHADACNAMGELASRRSGGAAAARAAANAYLTAESLGSVEATVNRGLTLCDPRRPGAEDGPSAATAYAFFEAASRAGSIDGLFLTAVCFSKGVGVVGHVFQSFERFSLAADRGHGHAQLAVSLCYSAGRGTEPSASKATTYLRRAAAQGVPAALSGLAELLRDGGAGLDADPKRSRALFEEAAAKGDPAGMRGLAELLLVAEPGRAVRLLHAAGREGDGLAALRLAQLYERGGGGVPRDALRAAGWYKQAAGYGVKEAARKLRSKGFRVSTVAARASAMFRTKPSKE
ncbi:hypothetical protein MMPV_005860 [Pyropia vietnamensis]